jgi:hypothetical protein
MGWIIRSEPLLLAQYSMHELHHYDVGMHPVTDWISSIVQKDEALIHHVIAFANGYCQTEEQSRDEVCSTDARDFKSGDQIEFDCKDEYPQRTIPVIHSQYLLTYFNGSSNSCRQQ